MGSDADIEIYRQRYETFRHLDKLYWQMLQILVAVGSASIVVARSAQTPMQWWFVGGVGLIIIVIALVMLRIRSGMRSNGAFLALVGGRLGDEAIPNTNNKFKSTSFWTAIVVLLVGALCVARVRTL